MQLVLLGAAVVSIVALQEWSTGLVIVGLTVLNAVLGLNQEGKAAESVAALQKMLLIHAHVRRGGERADIPAEELVPGDIVTFEAGDKVPADGRLILAATLEIEEAALTGESTPVLKSVDPIAGDEVPLGDRLDMAYMNSTVTRGRGEMVVTATGMATEVGQISGCWPGPAGEDAAHAPARPADGADHGHGRGRAGARVVVLGLVRGDDFDELFVIGISLAIAAIPTGLPAVVTTMLSLGTQALAAKGAIVKRLRSVETLGSTSAICSDKTGTLTLNQMTARELVVVGRRYAVEGEGYSTEGKILRIAGEQRHVARRRSSCRWRSRTTRRCATARSSATRPRRRSSCWRRRAGSTSTRNGAAPARRRGAVRLGVQAHGDLPRDGGRRPQGRPLLRQGRARRAARPLVARSGTPTAARARGRRPRRVLAENDRLAGDGLRVLAVASRDIDPADFDAGGDLLDEVQGLTLLALVGHRRPAAQGGAGRDRPLQGGRDPGADDHRRPRDDRGGDRGPARDRGAGAARHRVRRR